MWAKEPSGSAFNSLIDLELDHGVPRNPFINAGAIVVSDILMSCLAYPEADYLAFVRLLAGDDSVDYNREVASSEREKGYVNAAIANMLKYYGNLDNDIEAVLRFYFLQCSVEMSCRQLSRAFLPFADRHKEFVYGDVKLSYSQVKRINAIMQTCGFTTMRASIPILSVFQAKAVSEVASGPYTQVVMPWPHGVRVSTAKAIRLWA